MKRAVIITAKQKNLSIADKNLIPVCGKPCIAYAFEAARDARTVDHFFIFSDSEKIRALGESYGGISIAEPEHLTLPEANHGDAIAYAVEYAKKQIPDLEIVTVLLGNTAAINSELIDLSIQILEKDKNLDSSMSVWQAQDDHPYRALSLDENGFLKSFLNIVSGTSRQSYPPVYFYDQGVWTFRVENIYKKEGPNPWWWMGKKSFPIIRNWVTGRDIHTQMDVDFLEAWIKSGKKDEILNMSAIEKITRSS